MSRLPDAPSDPQAPVFARTIRDVQVTVTPIEELKAVVWGQTVTVKTEGDSATQIVITVTHGRSWSVYLYPPSVADLASFAADASALVAAIAAGLQAAGKDDLRSAWERKYAPHTPEPPRLALAVEPIKDVVLTDRRETPVATEA